MTQSSVAEPQRPRWPRRLALGLASTLVGLLLAEGAVRLLLDPPPNVQVVEDPGASQRRAQENERPTELRLPVSPGGELYVKTATGLRLRASTKAVVENHRLSQRDIYLRTNSIGYRNPEIGEKRGTRVLFLGDSITFADYVQEAETWVRLVEGRFRAQGREVETINAGVGAIGTRNELAILQETGLALEPDVVVVGFYLNDAFDSRGFQVLQVPAALRWSRLLRLLAFVVPSMVERVDTHTEVEERKRWAEEVARRFPPGEGDPIRDRAAFNALLQKAFRDWGSAWSDPAWELLEPMLEDFARLAEVHDFELYFLCFPTRAQVQAEFECDEPQQRLAEVLGRLEVPLLDLLPPLREAWRASEGELFYDQCHHTPRGNELVADWVHAFLEEQLPR